jgi:hypothetical protein
MVVSKSVHKRGQNIRKLASKRTIRGPQHSKDTVHWYLRCNLEAYLCKRLVLPKISKNQMANDFSFLRRDRSGQWTDLRKIIFTGECSVYCQCLEFAKMTVSGPKKGQNWKKLLSQVFSKNHGLGRNGSFRCVQPTWVAYKPNCES